MDIFFFRCERATNLLPDRHMITFRCNVIPSITPSPSINWSQQRSTAKFLHLHSPKSMSTAELKQSHQTFPFSAARNVLPPNMHMNYLWDPGSNFVALYNGATSRFTCLHHICWSGLQMCCRFRADWRVTFSGKLHFQRTDDEERAAVRSTAREGNGLKLDSFHIFLKNLVVN